jgi:hypothetical protein
MRGISPRGNEQKRQIFTTVTNMLPATYSGRSIWMMFNRLIRRVAAQSPAAAINAIKSTAIPHVLAPMDFAPSIRLAIKRPASAATARLGAGFAGTGSSHPFFSGSGADGRAEFLIMGSRAWVRGK